MGADFAITIVDSEGLLEIVTIVLGVDMLVRLFDCKIECANVSF